MTKNERYHQDCGHNHIPFNGNMLTPEEQRKASKQLTLAMLAIGLLALGLFWRWFIPQGEYIAQILCGVSSLIVAYPVFSSAYKSLYRQTLHGVTDQLIALAMLGAWAVGDLITAALLPIIMIFGHILEERSMVGSQQAIAALSKLTHSKARLINDDGNIVLIDNDRLAVGDRVEVRAGDKIPADGRIIKGQASLDTASITGESIPLDVTVGMDVFGGAINLDGFLQIQIIRPSGESTLGKIIQLMQQAERAKPPITRLLERYIGSYIVLVILVAAITWFITNDSQAMLSVLVAACPCALVLSAPATAIAGITVAARHGILIRSSAFLEEVADINSLIIDKTGTLTQGSLHLQQIQFMTGINETLITCLAASLGATSNHPVSKALSSLCQYNQYYPLTNITEKQGLGVIAECEYGLIVLGRVELFQQLDIILPNIPEHDGPITGFALAGQFQGWFLLADNLRPETLTALSQLRDLGLTRQLLLTGDRQNVAERIAHDVGIQNVMAQALPEDKLKCVNNEINNGFRPMVVGDGINDSLALKAGVVGVAMGVGGSDITMSSADIVLIGSDLRCLATCIRLSRRCRKILQFNVIISLIWTLAIVIAAAFGLLGMAGAMIAAILHNISTILVLGNAARLLQFDDQHEQ